MEQAIGTRIGASSRRGTKPSSSVGLLDCFVVPPRKDGKAGSTRRGTKPSSSECLLDCFVVPPRNDGEIGPSLRTEAEAIQKKGAHKEYEQLDCFVVPPRNDGKGRFVVPPRNDGKGYFVVPPRRSTNPAPSLRTEGEAIQKKGAHKEYEQLDCFVVPPRNDGKGSAMPPSSQERVRKRQPSIFEMT